MPRRVSPSCLCVKVCVKIPLKSPTPLILRVFHRSIDQINQINMKSKLVLIAMVFFLGLQQDMFAQRVCRPGRGQGNNQRQRILEGRRSGQLTPGEFHKLKREHKHLRRTKRMAAADGRISPRERRFISYRQHKLDRQIFRLKHNIRRRVI